VPRAGTPIARFEHRRSQRLQNASLASSSAFRHFGDRDEVDGPDWQFRFKRNVFCDIFTFLTPRQAQFISLEEKQIIPDRMPKRSRLLPK